MHLYIYQISRNKREANRTYEYEEIMDAVSRFGFDYLDFDAELGEIERNRFLSDMEKLGCIVDYDCEKFIVTQQAIDMFFEPFLEKIRQAVKLKGKEAFKSVRNIIGDTDYDVILLDEGEGCSLFELMMNVAVGTEYFVGNIISGHM